MQHYIPDIAGFRCALCIFDEKDVECLERVQRKATKLHGDRFQAVRRYDRRKLEIACIKILTDHEKMRCEDFSRSLIGKSV